MLTPAPGGKQGRVPQPLATTCWAVAAQSLLNEPPVYRHFNAHCWFADSRLSPQHCHSA